MNYSNSPWKIGESLAHISAILVAVTFGLATSILPPILTFATIGLIGITIGCFLYPAITLGIYTILILIIPDYKIADTLTAYVFLIFLVVVLLKKNPNKSTSSQAKIFYAYIIWGLGSLIFGVISNNSAPYIYRDARGIIIYWLWAPLLIGATNRAIIDKRAISAVILSVGAAVSTIAIIQALSGGQLIAGRVSELDTTPGVTRVQFDGFTYCLASLTIILTRAQLGSSPLLIFGILAFLNLVAIYVNFGRALWAWTIISIGICLALIGLKRGWRAILLLGILSITTLTGLTITKPELLDTLGERVTSVTQEGGSRTSYGWRKLENEAALQRIISSPLLGVGIGGAYRNWVSEISNFADHPRYIHNNYYFIATKTGPIGIALLISAIGSACYTILRRRKLSVKSPLNPEGVYTIATILGIAGLSFTQPELSSPLSTLLISLLIAHSSHSKGIEASELHSVTNRQYSR